MNLLFNPEYFLKPDNGKALLLTRDTFRSKNGEKLESVIHPIHAMILSFCNGEDEDLCIDDASKYLKVDREKVAKFVRSLAENKVPVHVLYKGKKIYFPQNTLLNSTQKGLIYDPDSFKYDHIDLRMGRHKTITDVTFMLTTKCKTNCIYCYATKQNCANEVPVERVIELIDEAKKMKMRSFDIIGGDIFAYKNWQLVLAKLYASGFSPFVSTKVPLKVEDIIFLKSIGVSDIQISLDTLIQENLIAIVKSQKSYYGDILETLRLLEVYNIEVIIHTIICNKNSSIEDIKSLEKEVFTHKNIRLWRIDPATYSLPKGVKKFENYKSTEDDLLKIYNYLESRNFSKNVLYKSLSNTNLQKKKRNLNFAYNRVLCTANYSHLFILPDGQVTICEQLYWNPKFVVGDININSLKDIWNSEKALSLYNIDQAIINKESPCSKCKAFDICRHESGGVCWKNVISAYGEENWDYPDPNCINAPDVFNNIYI
ncbi:MAG: radical SAM protein [Bacteroides sp.]|jgi:radical SAM protein with 4Fe4S-binding SPASM domain|nr:radical SAM protein [Bacteroides sp.]MCI1682376.1 radical SAM protein [Bacteroides sp.]